MRSTASNSGVFAALGTWATRHPWLIIAVWAVLATVAGFGAVKAPGILLAGSGDIRGSQSEAVDRMLVADFDNPYTQLLVVTLQTGDPPGGSESLTAAVDDLEKTLAELPQVRAVMASARVPDIRLMADPAKGNLVYVGLKATNTQEAEQALPIVRQAVNDVLQPIRQTDPTLAWAVTGRAAFTYDLNLFNAEDSAAAEQRVIPLTLLILLVAFGALVAAGIPLAMGLLAMTIAMGCIYAVGQAFPLSNLAQNVTSMVGLAAGIDYSLIVVNRFREALHRGQTVSEAVIETTATAGKAVAYSGLAVMIGLAGLFYTPLLETRSIGIGGLLVIIVSVLLAISFLPALLMVIGPRVDSPRWLSARLTRPEKRDKWVRLANRVMARPKRVIAVSVLLLLTMAAPTAWLRFGFPAGNWLPEQLEVVRGAQMLVAMGKGGLINPVNVILRRTDGHPILTPEAINPLLVLSERVKADQRVAEVFGPVDLADGLAPWQYAMLYADLDGALAQFPMIGQMYLSKDRSALLMQIIVKPDVELQDAKGLALSIPAWTDLPGTEVLVGGQAAFYNDFDAAMEGAYPRVIGLVLALTFVVLAVAFRSILVPLKAIAMNLLSVLASFGVLVLVFQFGYGGTWIGLPQATEMIPMTMPLMIFCLVFGLSMDYEVFLLTRIKEAYDATGDNRTATAEGLAATGGIITSAALIMVAVFGAFALAQVVLVKMLGFGLALAVLVDATVIRVLLVPALMRLMGRWNWWPGSRPKA